MGSLISGEQWLLELSRESKSTERVAALLLRMQILTGNRTGHLLVLGYEYTRRRICNAARHGHVASVMVQCQRCFCQALLSDWEEASRMTTKKRQEAATRLRDMGRTSEVLFLRPCPGNEYAMAILESPQVRGVR